MFLEPRRFGPYVLLERLGEGGMGTVFVASKANSNRKVAIKLIRTDDESALPDPFEAALFDRECRIISRLDHRHIAPVHNFGVIANQPFLEMALLPGVNLHQLLISEGPLPSGRALSILHQAAGALGAAHAAGVIHRDVKPQNILVDTANHDFTYLVDFGVARRFRKSTASRFTAPGLAGTLPYIAPEVWLAQEAGPSSDVYSLACVLYECLTGSQVFDGPDYPQFFFQHTRERPRPVTSLNTRVSADLARVVERGLAKDPRIRHNNVVEFIAEARSAGREGSVSASSREDAPSATPPTAGSRSGRPIWLTNHPDGSLGVWDILSGSPLGDRFRDGLHHDLHVLSEVAGRPVAVSSRRASERDAEPVWTWDLATGETIGRPYTAHRDGVIAFTPVRLSGEPAVVSCGFRGDVRIWSLRNHQDLVDGRQIAQRFPQRIERLLTLSDMTLAIARNHPEIDRIERGLFKQRLVRSGPPALCVEYWDLQEQALLSGPHESQSRYVEFVKALEEAQVGNQQAILCKGRVDWSIHDRSSGSRLSTGTELPSDAFDRDSVRQSLEVLGGRAVLVQSHEGGLGGLDSITRRDIRVFDYATKEPLGPPLTYTGRPVSDVRVLQTTRKNLLLSAHGLTWDIQSGRQIDKMREKGHTLRAIMGANVEF